MYLKVSVLAALQILLLLLDGAAAQLHFMSIGNWGAPSLTRPLLLPNFRSTLRSTKSSFIISPGSNFPVGGIKALNDTRWSTDFADIFSGEDFNIRFFTVLGIDDWAGNVTAQALRTDDAYDKDMLNSTAKQPRWTMPNYWYRYGVTFPDASSANGAFTRAEVSIGFVFIDTYVLSDDFVYANITELHWNDLKTALDTYVKIFDWVVVVGDKAIYSSGASKGDPHLEQTLRPLMKNSNVDVFLSGKDRDLEVIEDENLAMINCGSGSMADAVKLRSKDKQSKFFAAEEGYCSHTVTKKELCTDFINGITSQVLYRYCKQRNTKPAVSGAERHKIISKDDGSHASLIPIPAFMPIPERDIFVQIVGTIGIVIWSFLVLLTLTIIISRIVRLATGGNKSDNNTSQPQTRPAPRDDMGATEATYGNEPSQPMAPSQQHSSLEEPLNQTGGM